jgi:hypothetical protein
VLPDERPRLGGEDDLAGRGQALGNAGLLDRRAGHREEPPLGRPTQVQRHDIAGSEAYPNRQALSGASFRIPERCLRRQAALRRTLGCDAQSLVRRRPQREQGVAGELDHVAPMSGDDPGELVEVGVQEAAQLLDAGRATLRQAFGQGGPAGDVGEHDRRREPLGVRFARRGPASSKAAQDERGLVAGQRVGERGHRHASFWRDVPSPAAAPGSHIA